MVFARAYKNKPLKPQNKLEVDRQVLERAKVPM
jgi:hypothetical protein